MCASLECDCVCELDFDLCYFDVDQAFVQSKLNEDVYLRLPKGLVVFPVELGG